MSTDTKSVAEQEINLATIELTAQETGTKRYESFTPKVRGIMYFSGILILVIYGLISASAFIRELNSDSPGGLADITLYEARADVHRTFTATYGCEGSWCAESACSDDKGLCRVSFEPYQVKEIDPMGEVFCYKHERRSPVDFVWMLNPGDGDWYGPYDPNRMWQVPGDRFLDKLRGQGWGFKHAERPFNAEAYRMASSDTQSVKLLRMPQSLMCDGGSCETIRQACNGDVANALWAIR